jgi:hypothetical protein
LLSGFRHLITSPPPPLNCLDNSPNFTSQRFRTSRLGTTPPCALFLLIIANEHPVSSAFLCRVATAVPVPYRIADEESWSHSSTAVSCGKLWYNRDPGLDLLGVKRYRDIGEHVMLHHGLDLHWSKGQRRAPPVACFRGARHLRHAGCLTLSSRLAAVEKSRK